MKSIPQEIDELMWGIAESGDRDAVYQFEVRHPAHREELLKRLKSVDALKKAGRDPKPDVPVFRQREVQPINLRPIYWTVGLAGVLLLGVSGYAISRNQTKPQANNQVPVVNVEPPALPNNNLETGQPVSPPQTQTNADPVPQKVEPGPQPIPEPDYEPETGKTSMKLASAPLHSAIKLIAASGQLTVTIAPGLPNPDVEIDYQELTPLEMLRELGKDYAFSPVVDGEREILILPIVEDDNRVKSDTNQTD